MKRWLFIAVIAVAACKGRQTTTDVPPPVDPVVTKPSWVASRPLSDAYYVGIGTCPKSRPDFQESAKKNALNDLASEISVRVEGNSLLYTLDRKNSFDESFTSTIKTTALERIEGFELVDSYDDAKEVWVYYRLSKAEHARIKAERKRQAIASAVDLYTRAQASVTTGDLKGAVDQFLRAMLAMKEYWGENDMAMVGEKEVPIVNEIYGHLQRTINGVRITALPERCKLDLQGRFKREVLVTVKADDGKRVKELSQVPMKLSYPGLNGKVSESKSTDTEGHLRTTVQRVDMQAQARELLIELDLASLVSKDLDPPFVQPLLNSLTAPSLRVAIDVEMPRVFMQVAETNLGQPVGDAGAAMAIKEELTTKGFRFVDGMNEADLLMKVNGSTREGGEANGFFTAYLDLTCTFKDKRSGETIYEGGKQGIKGIQLNYNKAGLEAYKKAGQELRGDIVGAMLNAVL